MMKRIIFTLALLFALSVNAQIIDTVKIMQIHTVDGVTSFEVDNIDFIDFYYKINITPEKEPIDTFNTNTKADKLYYKREFTKEGFLAAKETLKNEKIFDLIPSGTYCLRGGRIYNGVVYKPSEHGYQYQYNLGPDNYAQYFTVPHKDFMIGSLTSTYDLSAEFNNSPLGAYTMAKNAFMPVLHHPMIDSIPEIKAIVLLYYSLAAQENADLSGPFTYFEDKQNSEAPTTYNKVDEIYNSIVANIDTIVNCLKHFETRPEWYKKEIDNIISSFDLTRNNIFDIEVDKIDAHIRLANSLKLRMAMHIVKADPKKAEKWAVDAVASGVIESQNSQMGFFQMKDAIGHPLVQISNWGDTKMSASFESLLISLDHPYTKTLFKPNSEKIINRETGEVLEAGTRICGIRSGVYVGAGQSYQENQYQAYSTFKYDVMAESPLYFIKWSEVDFLRAEGALRGWNMGGSAQFFYERGIKNADLVEPTIAQFFDEYYDAYVDDYMQLSKAIDYVSEDPIGDGEPWPSVTKIGVKWDDDDSKETKLEKIITQKYIALFPLSTEAWTEMRRTGYPKMFPVLNTDDGDGSIKQGEMIRRIPWVPKDEETKNIIETSGIKALGGRPDDQATRLWWDVDKANF